MGWLDDIVPAYRDYGLVVREQGAWKTRTLTTSAGIVRTWRYGKPIARVNHHFVINFGTPDMAAVNMIINGYSGGPKPPVVNEYLGQTGIVYLIAGGPTSHPGMGSRTVLNRLLANQAPLGDAGALGYANDLPQSEAEVLYWGVETHHPGTAVAMPDIQYDALVKINAALAEVLGWPAERNMQHREHTGRKQDIHKFAVNAFTLRRQSAALMTGLPPEENFMAEMAVSKVNGAKMPAVEMLAWNDLHLNELAKALETVTQRLGEIPTAVWTKSITDENANVLLARAATPSGHDPEMAVVLDEETGAKYAIGSGRFYHLPSEEFISAGRGLGLLGGVELRTNPRGIDLLRAIALGGPSDRQMKDVALVTHIVVAGETLNSIATKYGTTVEVILALNPQITDPDAISVGDLVIVSKT